MKLSSHNKQLKSHRLASLDGVRDVALGHKATAERPAANYAKSEYAQRHKAEASFSDVDARNKRWGIG